MIGFDRYDVISFDCYGSLIDWEGGVVCGLRPVLQNYAVEATDEEILNLHAQCEHELQSGSTKGATSSTAACWSRRSGRQVGRQVKVGASNPSPSRCVPSPPL